jgi:lantibiotic modifying enzyme
VERIAHRAADRARSLIDAAAHRRSDPLHTVSWCNGLAGSARVLLHAGQTLNRQDFTRTAIEGGDVCTAWAPRLEVLGQCCGAAGVGDLLIDLANATGETRYSEGARDVLRHILLRSDFAGERPMFLQGTPHDGAAAWGIGTAGVLGFLRRLRDGGGPRILPCL